METVLVPAASMEAEHTAEETPEFCIEGEVTVEGDRSDDPVMDWNAVLKGRILHGTDVVWEKEIHTSMNISIRRHCNMMPTMPD